MPSDTKIVLKKPLVIDFDSHGHTDLIVSGFKRNQGHRLLHDVFTRAGMTGSWKVTLFDTFKSTGRTPPLQIRKPDTFGVVMWVKPGDNGSGVRARLVVTKDQGTPTEVFKKLQEVVAGGQVCVVKDLPAIESATFLEHLSRVNPGLDEEEFIEQLHDSLMANPAPAMPVPKDTPTQTYVRTLVDYHVKSKHLYVPDKGAPYALTATGQALVYLRSSPPAPTEPAVKSPSANPVVPAPAVVETIDDVSQIEALLGSKPAPPSAPVVPVAPAQPATDKMKVLALAKARLEELTGLPVKIDKIRARRNEIKAQIDKLATELSALDKEEARLLNFDVEALQLLAGVQ